MEKQKNLQDLVVNLKNLNEDTDWKIIKNEESSFVGYTKTSYKSQILKYRFLGEKIEVVMKEKHLFMQSLEDK